MSMMFLVYQVVIVTMLNIDQFFPQTSREIVIVYEESLSTKTCINKVVDKFYILKCTAKTRYARGKKSDKPWLNKSCLEKRKNNSHSKKHIKFCEI